MISTPSRTSSNVIGVIVLQVGKQQGYESGDLPFLDEFIGARSGRDLHILHGKVIYRRTLDTETSELPLPSKSSARTSP